MREKVTASIIFKSRKASYPKRYFHILSWLILTKIYIICKLVSRSNHLETKRLSLEKKAVKNGLSAKMQGYFLSFTGKSSLISSFFIFYFTYFRFFFSFLSSFCNLVTYISHFDNKIRLGPLQLNLHETDLLFRYSSHHLTWHCSRIYEDLHRFAAYQRKIEQQQKQF